MKSLDKCYSYTQIIWEEIVYIVWIGLVLVAGHFLLGKNLKQISNGLIEISQNFDTSYNISNKAKKGKSFEE